MTCARCGRLALPDDTLCTAHRSLESLKDLHLQPLPPPIQVKYHPAPWSALWWDDEDRLAEESP